MLLPIALGLLVAYLLVRLLGIGWKLTVIFPAFVPLFGAAVGALAGVFLLPFIGALMDATPETMQLLAEIGGFVGIAGLILGFIVAGRTVRWAQRNHDNPAAGARRTARAIEFVAVTWPVLAMGAALIHTIIAEDLLQEEDYSIAHSIPAFAILAVLALVLWNRYRAQAPARRAADPAMYETE